MTGCPSLEGHMVYVEQVCVGLGPALNLAHVLVCTDYVKIYCHFFSFIFQMVYRGEEVGSI